MAKDPQNEARSRALRNIRSAKARPVRDAAEWAAAITQGDRTALAQAISLIESRRESDRPAVESLLQAMPAPPHPTRRIGITGVPGVGKSTWIEAAGTALLERGHQVAVLAVDPSSSRSGGSMLGDKTRMDSLSRHPRAFVRPSPAGDTLGGVARATMETIQLCEAAGFDRILIETVGVGQSETEVRRMTDAFLLLMLPGGGDGVQGIKRGILEWADVVIMNKADGPAEQIDLARSSLAAFRGALALMQAPPEGAPPLLGLGSGLDAEGVGEWVDRIESRLAEAAENGSLDARRRRQDRDALLDLLDREILMRVKSKPGFEAAWKRLQSESHRTQSAAFDALRRLLDSLD